MPYTTPPSRIKNLPKAAQDIWIATYNSAYKTYKGDEAKVNAAAWSAIKKAGYAKNLKTGKWSKMEGETTAGSLDPTGATRDSSCATKSKSGGKKMVKKKNMAKFEKWTTAYKNSLPDSSFAVVIKEGDATVRKLPFKDKDGKIDIPHLRNALVRVSQGGTDLSSSMRAKALATLKTHAKKYLKTYKETKSAEIMAKFMSKFGANAIDKLNAIIEMLKQHARNKKPKDLVDLDVKAISLLIADLEEIRELVRPDESKTVPAEPSKPPVEPAKEPAKEESKQSEMVEESKFRELLQVCEGYQSELEKSHELVSKFSKETEELRLQNTEFQAKISKFKEDQYSKLLNNTVEKVSKFKGLSETDKLTLKKNYLESKMSDSALEEIGRITDDQMFSKLEEPKETTRPTSFLEAPQQPASESKMMSSEDHLDMLAKINAKKRGFVQ